MPTNDFKPFATAAGANVLSQTDYNALAAVSTGWQSGVAKSPEVNKAIRQATFIAAAVAQYVADLSGQDVLDDGNIANFIAKLKAANGTQYLGKANNLGELAASGPAAQTSARTNLGLKGAAMLDVGATLGTVAAGDDQRITGALQKANNLADIQNAQTARNNLGLKALATKDSLTASDVGAITQAQADSKYVSLSGSTMSGALTTTFINVGGMIVTNGSATINAVYSDGNQYARLFFNDASGSTNFAYAEADFGKNLVFYVNSLRFVFDKNGNFSAPSGVYDSSGRVYSPGNKPSAQDVGAVPTSGGAITGPINVGGQITSASGYNVYAGQNIIAGSGGVYESNVRVYSPNNPPPVTTSASLGSSGWWKDQSTGMIVQWGSVSRSDTNTTAYFPIAFPGGALNVQLTLTNSAGNSLDNIFAQNIGQFGFTYVSSANEIRAMWLAIGY